MSLLFARRRVPAALVLLLLVGALVGALTARPLSAADKVYDWDALDVALTLNRDGTMRVVETHRYAFHEGSFTFAYRDLALNRLDGIEDIALSEEGRPYRLADVEGTPESYTVQRDGSTIHVKWFYPPTASPATRTFTLSYLVRGVVRVYDQHDEVFWKAVFSDRTDQVRSSTVTMNLPPGSAPAQWQIATYGSPAVAEVRGNQVVAVAEGPVAAGRELELRVSFPPHIVASAAPHWQAGYDRQRFYDEHVRPILTGVLIVLALLIAAGGILGTVMLWYRKGRDARALTVTPAYLPSPPDDLAPGLAASLLEESADNNAIVGTLFDLARRGHVEVHVREWKEGLFKHTRREQELVRRQGADQLAEHERLLLDAIFRGGDRELCSLLRKSLYARLGPVREAIMRALLARGFFAEPPSRTRLRYILYSVLVDIVGVVLLVPGLKFRERIGDGLLAVAIAVLVVGVAGFVVSSLMPRKTREGSAEATRWAAYRRYLRHLGRHSMPEQPEAPFTEVLAYAAAFGLAKQTVQHYADLGSPVPAWYASDTSSYSGSHGQAGGSWTAVPTLQSINDDFVGMLNSVSGSFASPSSSGSGSSGGGGGGGSGGGGGGAG